MAENDSNNNPHAGHRERMRNRYAEKGLDSFQDHEVLELLLFHAIPRANTNELAHALLKRFGSLNGVLEADKYSLQQVKGIGPGAAEFLILLHDVQVRCRSEAAKRPQSIDNSALAAEYLMPEFKSQKEEHLFCLLLDSAYKPILCEELSSGSDSSAVMDVRKLCTEAARYSAYAVILAHNHPSGILRPSEEDIRSTLEAQNALKTLGIFLQDHLIFSGEKSISLRSLNLI